MTTNMLKFKKPDGRVVEINDHPANVAQAKKLRWKRVDSTPPKAELDSRGLPWDERIHAKSRAKGDEGAWRYKQGVTANDIDPVEAELMEAALSNG